MKTILFFNNNEEKNLTLFDYQNLNIIEESNYQIESISKIFYEIKDKNKEIYFSSDNIEFLIIAYRLYNQIFDAFIYQSNRTDTFYSVPIKYKFFFKNDILKEESIFQPIYYLEDKPANISININLQKINSIKDIPNSNQKEFIQKLFYFNNKYLISESLNFNFKIINLNNSRIKEEIDIDNDFINLENHLIKHSKYILKLIDNPNDNLVSSLNKIKVILNRLSQLEQEKFIIHFKFLLNNLGNEVIKNYLNSFLANLNSFSSKMINSIVNEITNDNLISPTTKYFLFWQYLRLDFTRPLERKINQEYLWNLYKNIYTNYINIFSALEFIPKEKRNENLIFIFTGQFLGELHAPTKLLLERAYHLKKDFKKEVLIINSAEFMTEIGTIPFFEIYTPNKIESYSNVNQISYKDIEIPFYQSAVDMPNEDEIRNILSIVQEYKPYIIINIGSGNLIGDLCSNLITTVSLPTTSNIAISEAQIHINRTKLSFYNKTLCKNLNIKNESIIVSNPRVGTEKVSKVTYTKKDFNLPKDKFLISVVGNRLQQEVSEEFILMLLNTLKENTFIVFIGVFNNYVELSNKFVELKNNSLFINHQEHLYDVLKLFNLFVNPDRIGGGHGGLYSIMHSIPVVTFNRGDIHILTKKKFSVSSYQEMQNMIIKYIKDPIFYKKQSELAYLVYKEGTGIEEELSKLINDIEINPYFI